MTLCHCGHQPHHHTAGRCATVTISGPPSPATAKADGTHTNRTVTACGCATKQPGTGEQVQLSERKK